MDPKWLLAGCLVAALGIAAGLLLLLRPADPPPSARPAPPQTEPTRASGTLAEARSQITAKEPPRATQRATEPAKPPAVVKRPDPAPLPVEVLAGNERKLDRPDGDYEIEVLKGDAVIKLTGKIKTLKVPLVEGAATLDASALEAKEIIFTGKINNQATVKLNAPEGSVRFNGAVEGAAVLEVNAPGGSVLFAEPSARDLGREGSKIDGSARVTITAKDVNFRGDLVGGARVVVTLTYGGTLRFREIAGGAVLRYKKADGKDPEPTVRAGLIFGGGKVEKIE